MKNGLRIMCAVIVAMLWVAALAACERKEMPALPLPSEEKPAATGSPKPLRKGLPVAAADRPVREDETALVREDEEGLVRVAIEDGAASLSFQPDRWAQVHDLCDDDGAMPQGSALSDAFFPIRVQSGDVMDACVGKIPLIDPNAYGFVTPVVALLMQDGSVEWLLADPYRAQDASDQGGERRFDSSFHTHEKLPYADRFVSLSYESDGEGIGDKTIYVINAHGDRFDFRYMWMEARLYGGTWVAALSGDLTSCRLSFEPNGEASLDILSGSALYERWMGAADVVKAADQSVPPGTMLLDMTDGSAEKRSAYRAEITQQDRLILYYSDGDPLTPSDEGRSMLAFDRQWDEFEYDHPSGGEIDSSEGQIDYHFMGYIKPDGDRIRGPLFLLVDEVDWITDYDEPNDYRIENEVEEWELYLVDEGYFAAEGTAFTLWDYESMQPMDVSADDFIDALRQPDRGGTVLARIVAIEGGMDYLKSVEEAYIP